MRWVAPAFSMYPLGHVYTSWIYGDPQANPVFYDRPDKWENSGSIVFQDVALTTTMPALPVGNTKELDLKLTGGRNCVVFARYAMVFDGQVPTDPAQKLPTQAWSYVLYSQRLKEGYWETQETSIANVFGTGWSPAKWPAPITWNDRLTRTITLTNNTRITDEITVALVWKVAFLNTGA